MGVVPVWLAKPWDEGRGCRGGAGLHAGFSLLLDPHAQTPRTALFSRLPYLSSPLSSVADNVKYAKTHEWAKLEGDTVTVGISDHAQVRWRAERRITSRG